MWCAHERVWEADSKTQRIVWNRKHHTPCMPRRGQVRAWMGRALYSWWLFASCYDENEKFIKTILFPTLPHRRSMWVWQLLESRNVILLLLHESLDLYYKDDTLLWTLFLSTCTRSSCNYHASFVFTLVKLCLFSAVSIWEELSAQHIRQVQKRGNGGN